MSAVKYELTSGDLYYKIAVQLSGEEQFTDSDLFPSFPTY